MSRYTKNSFSRDNSVQDTYRSDKEPEWLKDFANSLEKSAVKTKQEDDSLYGQISSVIGRKSKSKYSSVEEAVQDMKKRTGLDDYLTQLKQAKDAGIEINASEESDIFEKIPQLKEFIDNYIDSYPGTSIDAVVHDALKILSIKEALPNSDDLPIEVKKYINEKLGQKQKEFRGDAQHINFGKPSVELDGQTIRDNNPLQALNPNNGFNN